MSFCTKFGKKIKDQDLFAIPVQLTYQGRRAFGTIYGGCISICMVLALCAYFCFSFHREYNHPDYLNLAPRYDYSQRYAQFDP